MMATPSIKVEEPAGGVDSVTVKEEFDYIKSEGSPMSEDDDQYEDAGDLDMSKGDTLTWLVKLPDFLLDRWDKIDDDEEIHLANVRVYSKPGPTGQQLKLFLTDTPHNNGIPRNYDMTITEQHVRNTYVFTEKDMPGFANKQKGAAVDGMPAIPARLLYPEKNTDRKFGKKRFEPYFRKAIPKRTALAGTVKHEAAVTPVENEEFRNYLRGKKAAFEAQQKGRKITVLEGTPAHNLLAPGTFGANASSFDQFIKPTGPTKKPQESKASRMPKNELLDALFSCFREYEFWTLKGLRETLQQPESYLKETLEQIGILIKTGTFALKWTLKPEYKQRDVDVEAINKLLKSEEGKEGEDYEDEDDEEEMEDVKF